MGHMPILIQATVCQTVQLSTHMMVIILVLVPVLHLISKIQPHLNVYSTALTSLLPISKLYKEQIDTVILLVPMANLEILLPMYALLTAHYLLSLLQTRHREAVWLYARPISMAISLHGLVNQHVPILCLLTPTQECVYKNVILN